MYIRKTALLLFLSICLSFTTSCLGQPQAKPIEDRSAPIGSVSVPFNLQPLSAEDVYGGSPFEDVSEESLTAFQKIQASLVIPDARKGERTTDSQSKSISLLASIPEKSIFLYGYHSSEEPWFGLIFDVGKEQSLSFYPYRYMTNTTILPDMSVGGDGNTIFLSVYTGNGTAITISELYVFQIDHDMKAYHVKTEDLVDALNKKFRISYDAGAKVAEVWENEKSVLKGALTPIGSKKGELPSPKSFYWGEQLSYDITSGHVVLSFLPTLFAEGGTGFSYFDGVLPMMNDIAFVYDPEGLITGFELS